MSCKCCGAKKTKRELITGYYITSEIYKTRNNPKGILLGSFLTKEEAVIAIKSNITQVTLLKPIVQYIEF